MPSDTHPDRDLLVEFGRGALPDHVAVTVEEHLANCSTCLAVAESAPDDSLTWLIRASGPRAIQPRRADAVDGYEVFEEIGRGGRGVVYRARQVALNRIVALKQLRDGVPARAEDAARFHAEAEAAARLRHPNIVPVFEYGERGGQPFLALELVDGGSLAGRLTTGPLEPRAAARLTETLARAMDYAHKHGVVHRDLKPGNVLLGAEPMALSTEPAPLSTQHLELSIPKIADFGLARLADRPEHLTQTAAIVGTPSYMSPEQAAGGEVGPLADVYALGAVLYECLTGRPPFRAATVLETLDQVRSHDPVSVRRLQPTVPRDLETVCLRCLEKTPSQRYATAGHLAADLRRFLDGRPVAARPVGPITRVTKWARRSPARAALVAVCVIGVAALVGGAVLHNARLRVEVERADRHEHRATERYRQAREALRNVLARAEAARVGSTVRPSEIHLDQLMEAVTFYESVLAADETNDSEVRHDLARAHLAAAADHQLLGRSRKCADSLDRAHRVLEQLTDDFPNDAQYASSLGMCYNHLGYHRTVDNRFDEAAAFHLKALAVRERLLAATPGDQTVRLALADTLVNLGVVDQKRQRLNSAIDAYRRAIALWDNAAAADPANVYALCAAANGRINLALIFQGTGLPTDAEALYREAECSLRPLAYGATAELRPGTSLAGAYLNWGNLLRDAARTADALDRYAQADALLGRVLAREPSWAQARYFQFNLCGARAQCLESLGRQSEAIADWDRAISMAPADVDRDRCRAFRLACLIGLADWDRVAAATADVCASTALDATALYNLACRAAPTAVADRTDADRRAALAVRLLRSALARGFADIPHLLTDPDLAPLRLRPAYADLLWEFAGIPPIGAK